MSLLWLVSRHVNEQKRELLQYLLDHGACDAEHAIGLSGVDMKTSILRSMVSRNVVKQTASGRYFLDASRVQEAYGASNRFILGAFAAFILAFALILLL